MKKTLLLCLLAASSSLFAQDYICPSSFECKVLNDPTSCKAADGSPVFQVSTMFGPMYPGVYNYLGVNARHLNDPSRTGCLYGYQQTPNILRQIFASASGYTLSPDFNAPGAAWQKDSDGLIECFADTTSCPFTDAINPKKYW